MNNNWTKDSNLISSNQIEKLSKLYSINERFYLSLNEVLSSIFIRHCDFLILCLLGISS